jgi:uncharacterized membrane protein
VNVQREGIAAPDVSESEARSSSNGDSATRRGALLYGIAAIVSLIGLADAVYLTIEHLAGRSVQCTIVAGCSQVLSSAYATLGGFPVAGIGALAYFTAFSCATLAAFGYHGARSLLTIVVALMFLATLWLLFVQAFILRAFCAYCLLSAAVTLTLTGLLIVAARFTRAR